MKKDEFLHIWEMLGGGEFGRISSKNGIKNSIFIFYLFFI